MCRPTHDTLTMNVETNPENRLDQKLQKVEHYIFLLLICLSTSLPFQTALHLLGERACSMEGYW